MNDIIIPRGGKIYAIGTEGRAIDLAVCDETVETDGGNRRTPILPLDIIKT